MARNVQSDRRDKRTRGDPAVLQFRPDPTAQATAPAGLRRGDETVLQYASFLAWCARPAPSRSLRGVATVVGAAVAGLHLVRKRTGWEERAKAPEAERYAAWLLRVHFPLLAARVAAEVGTAGEVVRRELEYAARLAPLPAVTVPIPPAPRGPTRQEVDRDQQSALSVMRAVLARFARRLAQDQECPTCHLPPVRLTAADAARAVESIQLLTGGPTARLDVGGSVDVAAAPVAESVRVRTARRSGDPTAVLRALVEDLEEARAVAVALLAMADADAARVVVAS